MNQTSKGFVVSAVLYPLLVLFLALIMGLLAMTDTRKRILDKMKLEISDSIFDEATCSCDTILNKLNYLIKNGVGGGGGTTIELKVTALETPSDLPFSNNKQNDFVIISDVEVTNTYVSSKEPSPTEGMVWVHVKDNHDTYINYQSLKIPVSYVTQYIEGEWVLKKAYIYDADWKELNYIEKDYTWDYSYTGEYQTFEVIYDGIYQIELWGAGNRGAYTSGEIDLASGMKLYVYVGQKNVSGGNTAWNGGGISYYCGTSASSVISGAGATDVRITPTSSLTTWDGDSLRSRIMVAAGSSTTCAAGGLVGYRCTQSGYESYAGYPGTQTSGGSAGATYNGFAPSSGGFGYAGYGSRANGAYDSTGGGYGGGGGWYGGGGGSGAKYGGWLGGGGSSYISGHAGCVGVTSAGKAKVSSYSSLSDSYSYTGYIFSNTRMIDGSGYEWTISKQSLVGIPCTSDDCYKTSHDDNGYAKITLLKIK